MPGYVPRTRYVIRSHEYDDNYAVFLQDVEICGVVHKKDTTFKITEQDQLYGDKLNLCFGHGAYCPLIIGIDIAIP